MRIEPHLHWHKIEVAWHLNGCSVRRIATDFGVAESAIRARAKRERWTRAAGSYADDSEAIERRRRCYVRLLVLEIRDEDVYAD